MGHGKTICKECKKIMIQCRCMEGHKKTEYDICEQCKTTPNNKTMED